MCVFWSSLKVYLKNFLITRRIQRDIVTGVNRSSCAWHFCPILNKLEFYRHILTKISNKEFHKKYSIGRGVFPRKRTDGQMFMTLIVTFRNLANASKSTILPAVYCGCTNRSLVSRDIHRVQEESAKETALMSWEEGSNVRLEKAA